MKRFELKSQKMPGEQNRLVDPLLLAEVAPLVEEVYRRRDAAVREQRRRFDGVDGPVFRVAEEEIQAALNDLNVSNRQVLEQAADAVRRYARRQMEELRSFEMDMGKGVWAGQRVVPVDSAAIYVPGGRFPLPSSLIMGVVPAQVAGVRRIVVFSPPRSRGSIDSMILATGALLGINEMYALGGVTAVAAAAYGTETIPEVDIIAGPGNRYVTAAKKMVFGDVGIDALAGPSEVLIVADESVSPVWVAADLLAQAEHDPQARSILFCREAAFADAVEREIESRLESLPGFETARSALEKNGRIVLFSDVETAVEAINDCAPEHLELMVKDSSWWEKRLRHYGTLFIGPYSVEALGDYGAGPNHTLPTARTARFSSGLSVRNFVKFSSTLRVEKEGFDASAPAAMVLAEMEGLEAHRFSLQCRLSPDRSDDSL